MKIHEYQGKELLKKFGMTVPTGIACFSVDEAVKAAEELGKTLGTKVWVVKAQIHAGGRGKGGGVKVAKSLDEVRQYASQILGMQLITHQTSAAGQKVNRLLIEEGADIKHEYYVAAVTDRATQKVAIMASSEGGMDIEEVAHATPEKILKVFVDLYDQGLIYRDRYIVNWCTRCGTALSDLETVHEQKKGRLYTVLYPFADGKGGGIEVATTRPETMLADGAVAVHPEDERYRHLIGKRVVRPVKRGTPAQWDLVG